MPGTKDGKLMPNSDSEIAKIDSSNTKVWTLTDIDMLHDLEDAFKFYDTENDGIIRMSHFRNILQNFGFHGMQKKDIDEEMKRTDSQFHTRTFVTLDFVKAVVAYRQIHKHGADEEAAECWALFDKRNKLQITAAELKQVLSSYLDFPVSEQDIHDFINMTGGAEDGLVKHTKFCELYTGN